MSFRLSSGARRPNFQEIFLSMRKMKNCVALFAFAVLVFATILSAQSDLSSITGLVKDTSGSVIPNAKVTVRNEATGVERTVQSNDNGVFTVTSIPSGLYTVIVEAQGFKKFQKTNNKLDANLPLAVDVDLTVGAVTEVVDVVANAQRIQTETATVGKLVDETTIKSTILNGRNPILLAAIKPGVRAGGSLAGFSFGLTNGGFAMNGSRSQDNVIFVDGAVAVRTRSNGTSIGAPDVDTVQEMQIMTANYNAEYGRSGGGQIRVVTKSGGQQFHGNVYEYFRNSAMDANTWTRNRSPFEYLNSGPQPLRFNQFGWNFGGPVFIPKLFNNERKKLFFLFGQEWVRYRLLETFEAVVPSQLMRQGNFSELLGSNPYYSTQQIVRDPNTGLPFPNNVIPANQRSANGIALLSMFPLPTPGYLNGRNNYIDTGGRVENQRKDTFSVDFVPTDKQTLRWRYQQYEYEILNSNRGSMKLAPDNLVRPNETMSLNHTWVLKPTLINEAMAAGAADHVNIAIVGNAFRRGQYGITYPYLYPASQKDFPDKIPTVNIANFSQADGGPYPSRSAGPIYTFADNLTWVKSNHTFKFGVLFERQGQNDRDQINVTGIPGGANNQAGRFDIQDGAVFPGTANVPGVARLALGQFNTYAEIGPRSYTLARSNMFEWFAQDSWRVTKKLKLELGLRHSIMQPYKALWGNYNVFDARYYDPAKAVQLNPTNGTIIPGTGDPYNGVVIPGSGWPEAARGRFPAAFDPQYDRLFRGLPDTYASTRYGEFVPRLGLAYQINDKTVFRTGFGGFKNRPAVSDSTFLGGNAPFQGFQVVSNGNVDNPGGSAAGAPPQFFMTQDPVYKIPTAYNWNFTLERQLPWNMIVDVAYVGRVGLYMERTRNLNQLAVGTCPRSACPGGVNVDYLRPYKGFSQIQIAENAARSEYNGFQLGLNRRFAAGLGFGFAYTYSKSYDNASDRRAVIWDNFNDKPFWGPSDFDTRHVATINAVYDLPFLKAQKGFMGKVLGGWQVAAVGQLQTGTPVTLGQSLDIAGIGTTSFQPWQVNGNIGYGNQSLSTGAGDNNYWLAVKDPSGNNLVTAPANGTFTTTQTRNQYFQPGFTNWNGSLGKTFAFTETVNLRFRAEAFNLPNHPNLGGSNGGGLDTNPTSSTFGKITTKASNRNLQLSLRLAF
jgi:hypothetical protein